VVGINERLGFARLDTATALVPNLPLPSRRGVRVLAAPEEIETALTGTDLQVYRDHRGAAAALHFVVRVGEDSCYVIARRDRRKGLPLFASLVHVSDPAVLARAGHAPYRYFPLEPHWLFPGLQFMPMAARARLAARWPLAHSSPDSREDAMSEVQWTELVGVAELKSYFPGSTIHHERVAGLTKSLVAVGGGAL
jgi:hypothetical protein